jgi:uncharacterized protein YjeT (DUF2065 family)
VIANILLAVGLVMIIEGLVYALAPSLIEDLLEALRSLSLVLGVCFLLAARALGAG